ncbi:MAG: glutamate-1-semialdehyde 2,1-aminomutase [Proteobacteria bacterium]|nr:glutamate-1-semialdehyde 2,1-aminomutase [Pseudomonadota bacterium]MBU1611607.1 glutamate-1-semialdehyde 2,1-aminomutase [Pseudomonadota bacterium]
MDTISKKLFERACAVLPGGVNSPVRACRSVGCDPLFIARSEGARLWTVDGQELIDYVMSWGPMILGHSNPVVREAAIKAVGNGTSYGAPCPGEVDLAEVICQVMPDVDMVRMVSSGTEATMSAVRLARGYTGRDKIIKFDGGYHGHSDCFLAAAGSGVATLSIPGTPGVPDAFVEQTLIAPYNDLAAVEQVFAANPGQVAALIVEPVAGNIGCVLPGEGYLAGLRKLCTEHGSLLIFDEVITGFRVALGGAQERFGVTPDLTTLGKIIGGGFPVGCYGGKREIMERIAPCGDVYQAGTLSGNPVAMAAGLATVQELMKADYAGLEKRTLAFASELKSILEAKGQDVILNHVASIFTLFFTDRPVNNYADAKTANSGTFAKFYAGMRARGVNLAPSGFECAFTSLVHTDADLDKTLEAARAVEL